MSSYPSKNRYLFATFVGQSVGAAFAHPFDTIKVRLQTMPKPEVGKNYLYKGTSDCIKTIIKREGFKALYKGVTPAIVSALIVPQIFRQGKKMGVMLQENYAKHLGERYTYTQIFNIGAVGGAFTTIVSVPIDRVKSLVQVRNDSFEKPLKVFKKLYREGGIRSIYRGTIITLIRDNPSSGIFCTVNVYLARKYNSDSKSILVVPYACAIVASCIFRYVTFPADVIKTRIQTAPEGKYPKGIRSVIKEIINHEGPSGFFRGFVPQIIKSISLNCTIAIVFFHVCRHQYHIKYILKKLINAFIYPHIFLNYNNK